MYSPGQKSIGGHDIVDHLDEGNAIEATITDLPKGFHFIPHDRLPTKLAAGAWIRG
jgi:hypothetical protein